MLRYRNDQWVALVQAIVCFLVCSCTVLQAATATKKARMYFNFGTVEIELFGDESPLNVDNFLGYVAGDSYDDSIIHRTVSRDPFGNPTAYFVQGGSFLLPLSPTPANVLDFPIATGDPVDNEFDASNGLSNTPMSLAAARSAHPDSATSGWFFNVSDNASGFDQGPYTVFGEVTDGWDLLGQVPFLPLLGEVFPDYRDEFQESTPLINGSQLVVLRETVEISLLDGDYNIDGSVDDGDLTVWSNHFGTSSNLSADGNHNGVVDGPDFLIWQRKVGSTPAAAPVTAAVPEPSTTLLIGTIVFLYTCGKLRRARAM